MEKAVLLVYTNHYYADSEVTERDVWKFTWDGKYLRKADNPGTVGECKDIDDVLERIGKYFYGTGYKITDIKPGYTNIM